MSKKNLTLTTDDMMDFDFDNFENIKAKSTKKPQKKVKAVIIAKPKEEPKNNDDILKQLEELKKQLEEAKKENKELKEKKKMDFKGKTYTYKDKDELARKLKINPEDVDKIKKIKYVINKNTGEFDKFDITEKPLILKEFGIKNISNKKLVQESITLKRKKEKITIQNDIIKWGQPMTFSCALDVVYIWESSGNRWGTKFVIDFDNETFIDKDHFMGWVHSYLNNEKFHRCTAETYEIK